MSNAEALRRLAQEVISAAESPTVVTEAAETAPSFPPDENITFFEETIAPSDTSDKIQAHATAEDAGLNREKLHERIVTVLKGHADGMKMIQLAELMGIKNWRSLIPVMRELLDERILGKVGSLYFVNTL